MLRTYIPHKISEGDIQNLSDKESRVIASNDNVEVEDPIRIISHSGEFLGRIVHMEKGRVEVEILKKLSDRTDPAQKKGGELEITIIQSVLKKEPMHYALEKLSEIGVESVLPVYTDHSEILKNAHRAHQEWERVAKKSKEQSYRGHKILIQEVDRLRDLKDLGEGLRICLTAENIEKVPLSGLLKQRLLKKKFNKIIVAVGPSEGWSADELTYLRDNGFIMVTLGDTILRAETAGLVAVSAIKFHYDML